LKREFSFQSACLSYTPDLEFHVVLKEQYCSLRHIMCIQSLSIFYLRLNSSLVLCTHSTCQYQPTCRIAWSLSLQGKEVSFLLSSSLLIIFEKSTCTYIVVSEVELRHQEPQCICFFLCTMTMPKQCIPDLTYESHNSMQIKNKKMSRENRIPWTQNLKLYALYILKDVSDSQPSI